MGSLRSAPSDYVACGQLDARVVDRSPRLYCRQLFRDRNVVEVAENVLQLSQPLRQSTNVSGLVEGREQFDLIAERLELLS